MMNKLFKKKQVEKELNNSRSLLIYKLNPYLDLSINNLLQKTIEFQNSQYKQYCSNKVISKFFEEKNIAILGPIIRQDNLTNLNIRLLWLAHIKFEYSRYIEEYQLNIEKISSAIAKIQKYNSLKFVYWLFPAKRKYINEYQTKLQSLHQISIDFKSNYKQWEADILISDIPKEFAVKLSDEEYRIQLLEIIYSYISDDKLALLLSIKDCSSNIMKKVRGEGYYHYFSKIKSLFQYMNRANKCNDLINKINNNKFSEISDNDLLFINLANYYQIYQDQINLQNKVALHCIEIQNSLMRMNKIANNLFTLDLSSRRQYFEWSKHLQIVFDNLNSLFDIYPDKIDLSINLLNNFALLKDMHLYPNKYVLLLDAFKGDEI